MTTAPSPPPRVNILAVDDIEENLMALEALLDRPDVQLLRAGSAERALEMMLTSEVAVALIDVQMPGMDGFELAELMRGSPRTRRIPIIFLTAGARDQTRLFRGYEAGAVDFLYKPLDPHILRGKIDVFIELHRQRAQLSEQVELLQRTIRLNEMFAAVLGHDLRGPLTAVLTGTALLLRNPESERVQRVSTRIAASATRMGRMIDQLLDVARLRHGQLDMRPAPADLGALVGRILLEQSDRAIQMESHGDTQGVWDADRLLQVVANLVGNACRHGDPAQPIRIRVDGRQAGRVVIEVANGGAIAPALLPRIFEPFLSGESHGGTAEGAPGSAESDRRRGGGLGLGLYIVKEIVEAHGGTVTVRSDMASGTCFRVELPRGAPAAAAMTAAPAGHG